MKKIAFIAVWTAAMLVSCGNSAKQQESEEQAAVETKTESAVHHLTTAEFVEMVADFRSNPGTWSYLGSKPAIVDFYASWCGPCRQLSPILEKVASQYEGRIVVYKVDVDKEPELAEAFGIRSIPTLLFVPMEGEPRMSQGFMVENELLSAVKSVLLVE